MSYNVLGMGKVYLSEMIRPYSFTEQFFLVDLFQLNLTLVLKVMFFLLDSSS